MRGGENMRIQKEQVPFIKQKIDIMINILKFYDCMKSVKFFSILQMMSNNLDACLKNNFEGVEILETYILEDWKSVCKGENGIENWYLKIGDTMLKEKINNKFQQEALCIDKVLNTNYIIPKKWFSYEEFVEIGKECKERKDNWEQIINSLKQKNKYLQSPIKQVPDDIWSYGKMIGIAENDEMLKKWFMMDISAFGYVSPIDILEMKNGDNILRSFMYDFPS